MIITTYANANRSYTVGLELTGKNKPAKWWDLTTNLNLFNSTIKAGNIPGTVSSSLFSWFAKINNNFKLPKNFDPTVGRLYRKTLVAPGGGGNRGMGMMFGGGSHPAHKVISADIRRRFLHPKGIPEEQRGVHHPSVQRHLPHPLVRKHTTNRRSS